MVNANTLADLLGGIVFWDPRTKTLTLAAGGKRFRFVQGSRSMDVDGQQTVLPLAMESDRRVPLKSVVAVLRGTVQVDLASFSVSVSLSAPGTEAKPIQPPTIPPSQVSPSAPAAPTPASPSPLPLVDPGPRELHPGSGAGVLRFGMDGIEISKLLGPPSKRAIWNPIAGLLYRPVDLTYQQFGIDVLLANGKLWGIATSNKDWVLKPYGVRVGDRRQDAIGAIGYDYETQSSSGGTTVTYKRDGIMLLVKDDIVMTIIVFLPFR
jgi:hypothetical protein